MNTHDLETLEQKQKELLQKAQALRQSKTDYLKKIDIEYEEINKQIDSIQKDIVTLRSKTKHG
jgi:predicted  nucleic acid-binding Zn-ribbon protein